MNVMAVITVREMLGGTSRATIAVPHGTTVPDVWGTPWEGRDEETKEWYDNYDVTISEEEVI